MNTAHKGGLFLEGVQEAVVSMSTPNRVASEIGKKYTIHACTDITGFSLAGHSHEMASGSSVSIVLDSQNIPLFTDVIEAAEMGIVPAATYGNRKAMNEFVYLGESLKPVWSDICFDPQTSGGLLFAVPADEADCFCRELRLHNVDQACIIGEVIEKGAFDVYVK